MYALYDNFSLKGQCHISTWSRDGRQWAAFSRYQQQAAHELYLPHTVLNLVLRGQKRMYDGRQVCEIQAGDVLVIPAGTFVCSEILRPSQDFSSINLVIPDDMLAETKTSFLSAPKALVTLPVNAGWRGFASQLLQQFRQDVAPPDQEAVLSQACALLSPHSYLMGMLAKSVKHPITGVMETLRTGLHKVRRLEEVAAGGHMSTATLKRRFRELYQCSPMQWIWERRLQRAGFLLRTTTMSIPEVAYSSGFEDLTHFYRQFRRCYQLTPAQWRQGEN
ncbi:helix-turn-helix domain-containing protein [Chitinophaga vietnamensis]|uniref:helix-turn-helix domain-containing protein n=1 Tax=Chitinophaga vietnamensis TaxID=2593957 RepID=UPI00117736A4|nr:AraC family transcriptional regulator [Chitinophaga vietnamensis]